MFDRNPRKGHNGREKKSIKHTVEQEKGKPEKHMIGRELEPRCLTETLEKDTVERET